MTARRIVSLCLIILGVLLGYFVFYASEKPGALYRPFKLGLDLRGGSHLVYEADTESLPEGTDVRSSMVSLREVIERRINAFGVGEPVVQLESSLLSGQVVDRLIVELPGVTDLEEAKKTINATPRVRRVRRALPRRVSCFRPELWSARLQRPTMAGRTARWL